jgi:hypothetical protein
MKDHPTSLDNRLGSEADRLRALFGAAAILGGAHVTPESQAAALDALARSDRVRAWTLGADLLTVLAAAKRREAGLQLDDHDRARLAEVVARHQAGIFYRSAA